MSEDFATPSLGEPATFNSAALKTKDEEHTDIALSTLDAVIAVVQEQRDRLLDPRYTTLPNNHTASVRTTLSVFYGQLVHLRGCIDGTIQI